MLKLNFFVAVLAYMAATQMAETAPMQKKLLRFQPITQKQYETILKITEGKPVISEDHLISSGIKNLQKFNTSPDNSWKALFNKAGLEVYEQQMPKDGETAGYPLCVIKSSDLDPEADIVPQDGDKKKISDNTKLVKKRPVVQCVIVVKPEENSEEPAEKEQPKEPETKKSEKQDELEKPEHVSIVKEEPSKTPEVPKESQKPQEMPSLPITQLPTVYAYYGHQNPALAALPSRANPVTYSYYTYGYPFPVPVASQTTQRQKKKTAQKTVLRNAANDAVRKQVRKNSPSLEKLRQAYPGYSFQAYNPFVNPSAYPGSQYSQPGYSSPGQQFPQHIPSPFPQQFPNQFPQQFPPLYTQQFLQNFSQQFPQQFPQRLPQTFPPQFPQDTPQKPSTKRIKNSARA